MCVCKYAYTHIHTYTYIISYKTFSLNNHRQAAFSQTRSKTSSRGDSCQAASHINSVNPSQAVARKLGV